MSKIGGAFALVAAAMALAGPAAAQSALGDWHGTLAAGGVEFRIGVTIAEAPGGALSGSLLSPDQGDRLVPLEAIRQDGLKLSFTAPAIQGRFEGLWDRAGQSWIGDWTQGRALRLTLARGKPPAPVRPQEPHKPYPYREEEVAIDSAPGVRLAGTLTLPPGKGPFPAAVLISGSGPQDRDEALFGHKPFLVLADHLTRQGVAVLRYDDRGFARSTGRFAEASSADFAADVEAALAYLRSRSEIDPARTGLIGHSEGGIIAPMVAANDPRVAFVVMIAGPGLPSRQIMAAQREAVARVTGVPPAATARNAALWSRIDDAVLAARDLDAARAAVTAIMTEAGAAPAAAAAAVQQVATAWYRSFIGYDPGPTLARLRIPVLALNGDKDVQVVSSLNVPALRTALKDDPQAEVVELPGLNHILQTSATGDPREYGRIEETMSPKALDLIGGWILRHSRR